MTTSSASGKVILFGEHAVVYGRPAIAVPVSEMRARASVAADQAGAGCSIVATDLNRCLHLETAQENDPLALIVRLTLAELDLSAAPDITITITSDIPIASGLGSGAAVSAAVARALAEFAGNPLPAATVSRLVYEVERLHHGTPSGIDNTVIAYEQPVYYSRGKPPKPISLGAPFWLVLADTGLPSPTRAIVDEVREAWQSEPGRYEGLFDQIGRIAEAASLSIEAGNQRRVGQLMDENQSLLRAIGVSSSVLDSICAAAHGSGAAGAKLSGAGRGGHAIALVDPGAGDRVGAAMRDTGAVRTTVTCVGHQAE